MIRSCLFALFLAVPVLARPTVWVSIPPAAWAVRQVLGDAADVQTLLPAGADAHAFEPTPRQLSGLSQAAAFVSIGVPFERRVVAALPTNIVRVALDAGISKRAAAEAAEEEGDPHIWMSPLLMQQVVVHAAQALAPLGDAAEIARRGEETRQAIAALDRKIAADLKAAGVTAFVAYHDAFGYFADQYGLKSIELEHDGKAPTGRGLAAALRAARAAKVGVVVIEPRHDRRAPEQVAKSLGAQTAEVDPLDGDWMSMMNKILNALCRRDAGTANGKEK